MRARYTELIAAIRKYSATTTIPGMAHIMGNMAEFLAELAEDAAKQTEENLNLQRKVVWLTWVLAFLTAALLVYTALLYQYARADARRRNFTEHPHLQTPQPPP
jgi:hypothetical protein